MRRLALLAARALARARRRRPAPPRRARRGRRSTTSRTRSCASPAACRSTSPSRRRPTSERAQIRRLIAQGMTKQQIKDALRRRVRRRRPRRARGRRLRADHLARARSLVVAARSAPLAVLLPRWRRRRPPAAGRRATATAAPASSTADARRASTRTSRATTLTDARRAPTSADTTVFAAFAVGFVSFISPCVLPLVPGYLSASPASRSPTCAAASTRWAAILWPGDHLLPVVHGDVRRARHDGHRPRLDAARPPADRSTRSPGALIVAMGVFFVLHAVRAAAEPEWRPDALITRAGAGGPVIAGAAFAVAWTPCVGPTLGAILAAAATTATPSATAACCSRSTRRPRRAVPADRRRVRPRDDGVPLAARPLPR